VLIAGKSGTVISTMTAFESASGATPDGCPKYLKLAKGFERQLRQQHRVSVATAVGCYLWLERQGYVRARPKSGFYVSRTPLAEGPGPSIATRLLGPVDVRVGDLGAAAAGAPRRVVELGPAVVGSALLPMNRLNRSIRLALSAFSDHAVRYEDPRGNLRLRRQIARLVFRQGATCVPDDIIVTSGATEALNLCIRAVAQPGDVLAVESPGCYDVLLALEALHMKALEVPHVPGRGVDLDMVRAGLRQHRIKALLVNATCHNPMGDCATDGAKAELVRFAAEHDIAIIEMDTFGDLLFSGERPRALKAFDRTGIVLQCASLAHYVAPGFNLGWTNAGRWNAEVARLKTVTNVSAARLPQLAMAEFLESGGLEKHLKRLRVELWRSVEASRRAVLEHFPAGTRVSRPEGGFVLWIELPDRFDGEHLQRGAAALGIRILAGSVFSANKQFRNCIRISCGHPFETIEPAIRAIAGLME
jgi:DNA-binding transcriptional MocR family regulator